MSERNDRGQASAERQWEYRPTVVARAKLRAVGLATAAWIFTLEYSLYLVGDDFADKLIKIAAALFMLLCIRFSRAGMRAQERTLLILFYALLFTALVPSLFVGNALVGVSQWLKAALMTIALPLLLADRNVKQDIGELLMSLYLWTGVIFSIQAIGGFLAVHSGAVDQSVIVQIERRPGLTEATLGIWGYANAVRGVTETFLWLRPQGWFLEPSLLGAFLILPAFVSLGRFLQFRKAGYLAAFLIVAGAILLTISLATYFGALAAVIFLVLSRPCYRGMARTVGFLRYGYPIVILASFVGIAASVMGVVNKAAEVDVTALEEQEAMLTRMYARDAEGPTGNLLREKADLNTYIGLVSSNPLGIGLADTLGENDTLAPNAVLFWFVVGGLPAMAVVVAMFGYIFYAFCHPLLVSDNAVYRCLAASFLGHAIHNLSYGNWLAPYFLIHLVIVCLVARQMRTSAPALDAQARLGGQSSWQTGSPSRA